MLNEMGINVVDSEDATMPRARKRKPRKPRAANSSRPRARPPSWPPRTSEPADRTDDPVRMYLREMGSVELLSREGEIAIAKRIEAGREAMIAGLCESPLTFQAIIIWRDELNDGKVLLRDIIDLEATYAGPDGKGAPKTDANGVAINGMNGMNGAAAAAPSASVESARAPTAPRTPPEPLSGEDEANAESFDDDDMENSSRCRRWKPN